MVTVSSDLKTLLDKTAEMHKHLCPRQVLGVRLGMFAAELFPIELPQSGKRLFAFVETDGCFADGVSVATGCSMGHRTMHLMDYGKVAVTLVDTQTLKTVRIIPSLDSRERAVACASKAGSRWEAQLEAYQRIPNEELFIHQEVTLAIDLSAMIGKPGTRFTCPLCGEEVINQREVMKNGQLVCQSCAGNSYWSPNK